MKQAVYIFYNICFLAVAYGWGVICWGNNTQGASCEPYVLDQKTVIRSVQLNTYFSGIWEGQFCRFTSDMMFCFYIFIIPLYFLLKSQGALIWGTTLCTRFVLCEVLLWLIIFSMALFYQISAIFISGLSVSLFVNAFLGVLIFGAPLLFAALIAAFAGSLSQK